MITGGTAPTLTDVWPEVAARLGRMLRHKGVDRATSEDAVQETALRVLREGVWFEDADDLFRWASVVAWRVAVDASRKQRRVELETVPDRAGPTNVALQVEQRSAVEALGAGLRSLSASDRQAILGAPAPSAGLSRREAVRLNVRRHRARARLLALLDGLLGVLAWLGVRRQPRLGRLAPVTVAVVVPVLSVALVLTPQVDGTPRRPAKAADYTPRAPAPVEGTVPPEVPTPAPPAAPEPAPVPAAGPAAATPVPAPALPDVVVPVPVTDGQIGGRARRPEDHDLCVDATTAVHHCMDATPLPAVPVPIPVTPPVPVPGPSTHGSARSLVAGIAGGLPA